MKDQNIGAQKCNSILDGVCVCVPVLRVISNFSLFILLCFVVFISSVFLFFLSSVIPKVKKRRQVTQTQTHTKEVKKEIKDKGSNLLLFFHLRLTFIVFKYSKNGRWVAMVESRDKTWCVKQYMMFYNKQWHEDCTTV